MDNTIQITKGEQQQQQLKIIERWHALFHSLRLARIYFLFLLFYYYLCLCCSCCLSVRMSVCQSVLTNLFVYLYDCLLLCKFVRQYSSQLIFMSILPNATSFQYKKNSKMISATFQSATVWANGRFLFVLTKSFKVTKK